MEVQTVFVAGAGKLGSGIAQVGIQSGLDVILRDVNEEIVRRAIAYSTQPPQISPFLKRFLAFGK